MSRADFDHENLERLKACVGPHLFELIRERGEVSTRARHRCQRCGGELNGDAVNWYRRGLAHGLSHAERRSNAAGPRGVSAASAAGPLACQ